MNTFFSALASSTGGLISVIAAFLISKILSKEEEFLVLDNELSLILISEKKFKNKIKNIKETRENGNDKFKEHISPINYSK